MLQKTDAVGYVKDIDTNVVTNNSKTEYDLFVTQRSKALQIKRMETDINNLKKELISIRAEMQKIMAERNV